MNKLLLLSLFSILLIGNVYAMELNPFADTVIHEKKINDVDNEFLKEDFNEQYGVIEITETFLWIPTKEIAEYSLTESTNECIFNCYAKGKVTIYKQGKLFDNIDFLASETDLRNAKSIKAYVSENKSNMRLVEDKRTERILENGTVVEDVSYKTEVYFEMVEREYKGEVLEEGNYEWRIEVEKSDKQSVDFILTAYNQSLNEWAWWNNSWTRKKQFNMSNTVGGAAGDKTNYSFLVPVTYDSDMVSNFSDVRFLNGSENTELDYWLVNKTDGVSANFYVEGNITNNINNTFYMYYGNSQATTSTSNYSKVFWNKTTDTYQPALTAGADSAQRGMQINATAALPLLLLEFVKNSSATPNQTQVWNADGTTSLVNGTFSGDNAVLDYPYPVSAGLDFIVGVYAGGSSYTNMRTSGVPYPINNMTHFVFSQGFAYVGGWTQDSGWYYSFKSIISTSRLSTETVAYFGSEESLAPHVRLLNPVDTYNSTLSCVTFSIIPISNVDTTGINTSLWTNISGSWLMNATNSSSFNATQTNFTVCGIPDNRYIWNGRVNDSLNIPSFNTTNRTFSVDTSAPAVSSNSSTTYRFQERNTNLVLYYTITDTNRDSCWIQWYNGTNASITCSTGSISVNTTGFYTPKNLTYWGNDSYGNYNSTFVNWSYQLFLESESYTSSILEGATSLFTAQLLTNGSDITVANLTYNNTGYTGNITESSNNFTVNRTISAPAVNVDTNISFRWNITQDDGTYYAITAHNQTVLNFGVDNCSSNTKVLYNFTMVDEGNQSEINETALNTLGKVTLQVYPIGSTTAIVNFSTNYSQINPFGVCFSSNLSSGESYEIDVQVQYSANGYEPEFYNIQNENLTVADFTTNITLYDLFSSDSQVFQISYKDESFLAVADALIQVTRKYIPEGVFKTVEIPMTDEKGETLVHLVLDDVIYTFIVVKDGEILGTFTNLLAKCQNPSITTCEINLNSFSSSIQTKDFNTLDDFTFTTFTFNESSRVVSTTFTIPSGSPQTVALNVTLADQLGNQSVCNQSLTTASGTLSCTIPSTFGNTTVIAKILKAGEVQGQGFISLNQEPIELAGASLVFLTLFLYLTLFGIGISDNPLITGISILAGILLAIGLNLVDATGYFGAGATVLWIIAAIVIVYIKAERRI